MNTNLIFIFLALIVLYQLPTASADLSFLPPRILPGSSFPQLLEPIVDDSSRKLSTQYFRELNDPALRFESRLLDAGECRGRFCPLRRLGQRIYPNRLLDVGDSANILPDGASRNLEIYCRGTNCRMLSSLVKRILSCRGTSCPLRRMLSSPVFKQPSDINPNRLLDVGDSANILPDGASRNLDVYCTGAKFRMLGGGLPVCKPGAICRILVVLQKPGSDEMVTSDRSLMSVDDFKVNAENRYVETLDGIANCSCRIVNLSENKINNLWLGFAERLTETNDSVSNFTNQTLNRIKRDLIKANEFAEKQAAELAEDLEQTKHWIKEVAKKMAKAFRSDWVKLNAVKSQLTNQTQRIFDKTNQFIHDLASEISNSSKKWVNLTLFKEEIRLENEWAIIVENLDRLTNETKENWNIVKTWLFESAKNVSRTVEEDWKEFNLASEALEKKLSDEFGSNVQKVNIFFQRINNSTRTTLLLVQSYLNDLARNISSKINETRAEGIEVIEEDWEFIQQHLNLLSDDRKARLVHIREFLSKTAQSLTENFEKELKVIKLGASQMKNETLEAWNTINTWVKELASNITKEINGTASNLSMKFEDNWNIIQENYANLTEEIKNKLENINAWISDTTEYLFTLYINWSQSANEQIKDYFHRNYETMKRGIELLSNRTRESFESLGNWLHSLAENITSSANSTINQTLEEFNDQMERDWEIVNSAIEDLDAETQYQWKVLNKWIILAAEKLRDNMAETAEKVINALEGWVTYENDNLANKTAILIADSQEVFERASSWFKKLLFCPLCNNNSIPVCVKADTGVATFLNDCYAKCADVVVLSQGKCPDMKENFAYVIDNQTSST